MISIHWSVALTEVVRETIDLVIYKSVKAYPYCAVFPTMKIMSRIRFRNIFDHKTLK